ncbi:MAG: (d)CMP kinase [Actinobacteria bacterium]|nr:(d)CMP kinase [Actinomycetota bacterium]
MSDGGSWGRGLRVIAIDGPAGTGKSTVARRVADRLGLPQLDTGAMYRAIAWAVLRDGVDPSDAVGVAVVAERCDVELRGDGAAPSTVLVDGVDVTRAIRSKAVTDAVSAVAATPAVRSRLRTLQRQWVGERDGGVLEGRDIGTVVVPDALVKVFLTATPEVRAQRRAGEAAENGVSLDVDAVARDLARRDHLDSTRTDSPLRAASDATVIDTSLLTVDEVVEQIATLWAVGGRAGEGR